MLDKMNQSLKAKESKKQKGHIKLFLKGYGCHLTNEEFITEQEADERDRKEKLAQKTQRKKDCNAQRFHRLEVEAEWKMMLDKHAKVVDEWEKLVEGLKAKNVCKKDFPKKPKQPKKPKPVADKQLVPEQGSDERQGNDSDDSEDDQEEYLQYVTLWNGAQV
ncbi:hypothetical protein BJV74DRAFT_795083 [Russula compacta]|nr:hypothetical protein BJV74DRAFT_795083 [Russula compacta]